MGRTLVVVVLFLGLLVGGRSAARADRVASDEPATQRKLDRFYTFLDRARDPGQNIEFRQQQIKSAERARRGLERRLDDAQRAGLDAELAAARELVERDAGAHADRRAERAGFEAAAQTWASARLAGSWTGPADTVAAQARFRAYRDEARRLADASTPDSRAASPTLRAHCRTLAASAAEMTAHLAELDKSRASAPRVEPIVLEIEALHAQLDASALLCTQPAIAAAAQTAARVVKRVGGLAAAKADRAAADRAAAAKVFMKPAARSSRELERRIERAFVAQGWKEPVLALRLVGPWEVVRHPATGVVVGRIQEAQIAVQLPDGSCRLYDFRVLEDAKGGALRRKSHGSRPMACANVPARKKKATTGAR